MKLLVRAHPSADAPRPPDLLDLARRVDRLSPDRRDPEAFHIEKSELAAELRRLANAADRRSPVR